MDENFSSLFHYLKHENISIDHDEFEFQAQSHPNYPSILSIVDTLSFFNINNGAISVEKSEIELLPDHFLALLDVSSKPQFYFIERKGEAYFYVKDKKEISKKNLELDWQNTVILIEKAEVDTNAFRDENSNASWMLPAFSSILFFSIIALFQISLAVKLFFALPIFGILCSLAALKDLFGTKSELLDKFCKLASNSSCSAVIESRRWKIFEILNFSDLSIVFFSAQFFLFFLYFLSLDVDVFFYFNKILIFCSLPLITASIYYQKFVEKKWCPICLSIILIILLELIYINVFFEVNAVFSVVNLSIFGFVITAVSLAWFQVKKTLTRQKQLKDREITNNRFMRNYQIFKNNLLSMDRIELVNSPIILGNKESHIEITVITSPFCSYCKEAHGILEKILYRNSNEVKIKILMNVNFEKIDNEKKAFFRILMAIYLQNGQEAFLSAFHDWFENKNLQKWIEKNDLAYNEAEVDEVYDLQNQWCVKNDVNFTPALYVNEYSYPTAYERESLLFFVNDLVDDDYFMELEKNYMS